MVRSLNRDTAVAKVGGREVDMEEAQLSMRRELQRIQRQAGPQFEADPRVRRMVAEQAVEALVNDRVLRLEQERLRIAVPDAAVRDYVRAMWLMLQQDVPEDYVVATGRSVSIRDMCRIAFDHVGLNMDDHVVIDPALFRPAEVDILLGDASKARNKFGWTPEIGLEAMILEMVDADMHRLRGA